MAQSRKQKARRGETLRAVAPEIHRDVAEKVWRQSLRLHYTQKQIGGNMKRKIDAVEIWTFILGVIVLSGFALGLIFLAVQLYLSP